MSLKSELVRLSKSGSPQRFDLFDFAMWCRCTKKEFFGMGSLLVIDGLAERSEDHLEQEYARFILETSE